MTVTAKDGGCPLHVPPHEHHEGMNECAICDEPIPCGNCGHAHLHGAYGCWGCLETGPRQHACMKYVKPPCICTERKGGKP